MKLSEAISLGHTLIGEDRNYFYNPETNCGCAIGSAAAAIGRQAELPLRCGGLHLLWEVWPWTKERPDAYPELYQFARAKMSPWFDSAVSRNPEMWSIAGVISKLHESGMPRLQIAALIAQIEPDSPQPGPAPSSPSSSMPAPVTSGVSR